MVAIREAKRRCGLAAATTPRLPRAITTLRSFPEGYPPTSFDAEEAVAMAASVFRHVEVQRWDGKSFPLSTRAEIRAYCRHNYIPPERAEQTEVPLWLTKRGVLIRARKP